MKIKEKFISRRQTSKHIECQIKLFFKSHRWDLKSNKQIGVSQTNDSKDISYNENANQSSYASNIKSKASQNKENMRKTASMRTKNKRKINTSSNSKNNDGFVRVSYLNCCIWTCKT